MFLIPFATSPKTYNIFVGLQQDNIDRMKQYDPAQMEPEKLGAPWNRMGLGVVIIGFATAGDYMQARKLNAEGKGKEALEFLSRGFAFRPELGDHDKPYQPLEGEQNG